MTSPEAPAQILSVHPITLPVPGRPVALELRVSAPMSGHGLPIVLLSHGHGPSNFVSSLHGYGPLANYYAARGFVVMDTPGYDPPSVTGMVAGGANVVVFTTGRGSCFGCKPTPSIKIASNTPMYERMVEDMDINAGEILNGKSVDKVGEEIFEEVLAVASGKKTKSELQGIGEEEFVPWIVGPTL